MSYGPQRPNPCPPGAHIAYMPEPTCAYPPPYPGRQMGAPSQQYTWIPPDQQRPQQLAHRPSGLGINAAEATSFAWSALSVAGATTGAYHGYARTNSIAGAVVWSLLGGIFPLITIPVSIYQGFGKPKK